MECDHEMQFGPVLEPEPREGTRPDQQGDLAVVPWGNLTENELPIYLDVDALLEMVQHAKSDLEVELGGVLLGVQQVDSSGRPFVVITDCLRAEHYQATRGSLKFTHETWGAITRQLAGFSRGVQMVGWYHTHPDWGVFLSSMDRFICEHFFNRPLDVAIVFDPVRDEHGIFSWNQEARRRMCRVSGGYLVSALSRAEELRQVASTWDSAPRRTPESEPDVRPNLSVWQRLKRMGEGGP
jgi:proteasome lid subunit RPN8/RPN11